MKKTILLALFFSAVVATVSAQKPTVAVDQNVTKELNSTDFKMPPATAKVHTWWHWMNGSISKEGITKDLEAMKEQGIGQATILNVGMFGEKNFGIKKVIFNTPEWHDYFLWALKEANRLGIKIGIHNCDGWSTTGGTWITPAMSMKQFVWTKTYISGNKKGATQLAQPFAVRDFYQDVAVLAYRTKPAVHFSQNEKPKYVLNDTLETKTLADGNPISALTVKKGDKIKVSFSKAFEAGKIVVHPRKSFLWHRMKEFKSSYIVSASIDGFTYNKISEFEITGLNESVTNIFPSTNAKFFQVELKDESNTNNWKPFTLGEMEILPADAEAAYGPSISHLLGKSVSVKLADKSFFSSTDTLPTANLIDAKEIINLTEKMDASGNLNWTAPAGNWCILRFGYTSTGAKNGPATKEGEGLECDKMDTAALNLHFANFPKRLIETAGAYVGNTFKFILVDSWESGYHNWTGNLPAAFEKNRGYDIINWIPVLCGETVGNAKQSNAFLYDFRKTLADMLEINYYKHYSDLLHAAKLEMHSEIVYGDADYPPTDILKANSYADMPMFEFWTGTDKNGIIEYNSSKQLESFPAFSAVGYNIPSVGSEAYTGMAQYSESLNEMKPYGDRAFCSGINQIILHSYVHQPFDKNPGMTLNMFGSHFNRNNSTWQHTSEWFNYQQRVQYVLQQGKIASNVLYFIGDQLPQYLENEIVNKLPFGYRGIACNFDMLKNKAVVKDGKICLDNGIEYPLLILPVSNNMELSTLTRIAELVSQGAVILGQKPLTQLSLMGITKNEKAFTTLANQVWGEGENAKITGNAYGKGRVYAGIPIDEVLIMSKIAPEFKTNVSDSMNLMYIHKIIAGHDVYFVANQLNMPLNSECAFAVGDKTPQIWNPLDGSILKPAVFASQNGVVRIPVTFKARESMIFVFENEKSNTNLCKVLAGSKQIFPLLEPNDATISVPLVTLNANNYQYSTTQSGSYSFVSNKNKAITKVLKQAEVFTIKDFEAKIEFVPGYDAKIAPVVVTELKPLTDFENPDIKYFAGTAKYIIKFTLPANINPTKDELMLDLGKFESSMDVTLNNKQLGIEWLAGTQFKIKGLLQKVNVLEVRVANIYRNRIIGDYIQYGELKNIWTSAPIQDFLNKGKPLKPSGLMGPLTIIKEIRVK